MNISMSKSVEIGLHGRLLGDIFLFLWAPKYEDKYKGSCRGIANENSP